MFRQFDGGASCWKVRLTDAGTGTTRTLRRSSDCLSLATYPARSSRPTTWLRAAVVTFRRDANEVPEPDWTISVLELRVLFLSSPAGGRLLPLVERLFIRKVEGDDFLARVRDQQVTVFLGIDDRRDALPSTV